MDTLTQPEKRITARRMAAVLAVSALAGVLIWLRLGATGQLDQGLAYALPTVVALVGLVAAIAACLTAFVLRPRPWALFTSRRPDMVSTLVLVAVLAVGFLCCDVLSLDQGDVWWEDSDRGWVAGWVTHFAVVGGLVVLLWWRRARSVTLVAAPVLTGAIAFLIGGISSDADDSATSSFGEGFMDVFPQTLVAALGMTAFVIGGWLLRGRDDDVRRPLSRGRTSPGM